MLTAAASLHAPAPSGDELLALARTGSESAFAALVREHQAMVFGLAYHFLQNRAQAEELAQDVFLALHQNLPRVESARHLVFWLRRVTSNRCIDCVRSSQRRRELPIEGLPEPGVSPRSRRSAARRAAPNAGRRTGARCAHRGDAAFSGGSRFVGDRSNHRHAGEHGEKPPAAFDGRPSAEAGGQRARL